MSPRAPADSQRHPPRAAGAAGGGAPVGPPAPAPPGGVAQADLPHGRVLWAVVAALHLALLALMLTRRLDFLFNDAMHRLGPGTDFAAYRTAGAAWLEGQGIYGRGPGFGFRYHPLFAMSVGVLLATLSAKAAYGLWVVLHEVALMADLLVLRRLVPERRRFFLLGVVVLLFSPYFLEVYMGNASFLVASLLLGAFHCHQQGRRAGFLLLFAASLLVKPLGLVFVPLLVMRRQAAHAALLCGGLAVAAAPYFVAHPDQWATFVAVNLHGPPLPGWGIHAGNQGLHGLLTTVSTRLSGLAVATFSATAQLPGAAQLALGVLPGALAALSLWASWRTRARLGLGLFLWSATYLLGYRDVWEHSYSFLVLGLGYLWATRALSPWVLGIASAGLALPTAFVLYDPVLPAGPIDPERHFGLATAVLHHGTKVAWVAVLYVACVIEAARRPDGPTPEPGPDAAAAAGAGPRPTPRRRRRG